jgi:hypothetical protein
MVSNSSLHYSFTFLTHYAQNKEARYDWYAFSNGDLHLKEDEDNELVFSVKRKELWMFGPMGVRKVVKQSKLDTLDLEERALVLEGEDAFNGYCEKKQTQAVKYDFNAGKSSARGRSGGRKRGTSRSPDYSPK